MPPEPVDYGKTVRIPTEHREQLRKVSKRIGLAQSHILGTLIDMADVHDLLRPDWQKRLKAALLAGDREIESDKYFEDPNRCPAIAKGTSKYKCIWGRKEKTPEVRVLEEFYEASKELCKACKITLGMKAETAGLREEVKHLTHELEIKEKVVFKVPICHKGATLNEDGTEFTNCPKHRHESVSVAAFCKVYQNKLPCMLFAERVIGVGETK